jgi:hypothetical protein
LSTVCQLGLRAGRLRHGMTTHSLSKWTSRLRSPGISIAFETIVVVVVVLVIDIVAVWSADSMSTSLSSWSW